MPSTKPPLLPNGFLALPLRRLPTASFPRQATHYLYLKPNAPRIPTPTTTREIFLANVPIDSTSRGLTRLFALSLGIGAGRVEGVEVLKEGGGGEKRGVVVSSSSASSKKRKISEMEGSNGRGGAGFGEGKEEGEVKVVGVLPSLWEEEVLTSGSCAVVRFVDEDSAALAWKAVRKVVRGKSGGDKELEWEGLEKSGSKRYLTHHRLTFPDRGVLKEKVDEYMAAYEAREVERARELAKRRAEPDEDGFITVTRGGRNGPAREEDVKLKMEELKAREKNRVGGDFYRFQTREKKKEVAKDLVKSFEEDARRVEEMRKRRGKVRPER